MSPEAFLAAAALGLALSADAFAAALCQGAAAGPRPQRTAVTVAAAFGAGQAVGPLIGFALGAVFASAMARFDHWVAFAILAGLGLKLIHEGLTQGPEDEVPKAPAEGFVLLGLTIATSIDAVAAGVTLPTVGLAPLSAAAVIGAVTAAACYVGVLIGRSAGNALGGKAEVIGGLALIGLGVKTLLDHGVFG